MLVDSIVKKTDKVMVNDMLRSRWSPMLKDVMKLLNLIENIAFQRTVWHKMIHEANPNQTENEA